MITYCGRILIFVILYNICAILFAFFVVSNAYFDPSKSAGHDKSYSDLLTLKMFCLSADIRSLYYSPAIINDPQTEERISGGFSNFESVPN